MLTDKMPHRELAKSIVGGVMRVLNTHNDCKSPNP
jgi:hypothetical protein